MSSRERFEDRIRRLVSYDHDTGLLFEYGSWKLYASDEFGSRYLVTDCPTLEEAIVAAAYKTGAPVGIKLISKS